jgi:protein-disulfide isomerase
LKDQAQLVFKHYPLDSSCNSKIHYPVHPNACKLATLAYCAQEKGRFWEFHDTVFFEIDRESSSLDWNTIKTAIQPIFSSEEVSACLLNEKAMQNVTEDIKVGTQVGVKGTPAVYINGKRVTIPLTLDTIKKLIELEATQ